MAEDSVKKILLIEDEEIIIDLLERKIRKAGYEVILAHDGEEGLSKMREVKFDLVLLDIIMPKIDGFEVMKVMKNDEVLSTIPIIIISNSGQVVELDEAKKWGARDWLIKTQFDPQEVLDKIKKIIG